MGNRFNLNDIASRKYNEEIKKQDIEALEFLLSDPKGRWFLTSLGYKNFVHTSTFTGNSTSFLNEGRRQVVLRLYDEIRQISEGASLKLLEAEKERIDFTEKLIKKINNEKGANNERF